MRKITIIALMLIGVNVSADCLKSMNTLGEMQKVVNSDLRNNQLDKAVRDATTTLNGITLWLRQCENIAPDFVTRTITEMGIVNYTVIKKLQKGKK